MSSRANSLVQLAPLSLIVLASACTQAAKPPRLPSADAPVELRRKVYADYELHESGDAFFGHQWRRADGEYGLDGIDPLLSLSPETQARRSEIEVRTWVLLPAAVAGGALLGIALGDDLFHGYGLSSSTRTGFYVAGGALAVGAVTLSLAWDPVSGIGPLYNEALAKELALTPPKVPAQR